MADKDEEQPNRRPAAEQPKAPPESPSEPLDEGTAPAQPPSDDEPSKPMVDELLGGARRIADDADRWFVSVARGLGRTARWTREEAALVADAAVAAGRTTGDFTKDMLRRLTPDARPTESQPQLETALIALGELVASYGPDDYAKLWKSEKLWRLLPRIQELGAQATAGPQEDTEEGSPQPEARPDEPDEAPTPDQAEAPPSSDNVVAIRPDVERSNSGITRPLDDSSSAPSSEPREADSKAEPEQAEGPSTDQQADDAADGDGSQSDEAAAGDSSETKD